MVPALAEVARATGGPVSLLEVGCSAGLNLRLDRYRLGYGDPPRWVGDPASALPLRAREFGDHPVPLPAALPVIADRVGLDRSPIDVHDEEAVRWLEACVFPDRVDRIERLRTAVEIARAEPVRLVPGDGVDGPGRRWRRRCVRTAALCVFHSWALTYFDDRDGFAAAVGGLADDRARRVWSRARAPVRAQLHAAVRRPPLARTPRALDHLRQGIHLRGYAQKNPKQEYKREAFELFTDMLDRDQARSRQADTAPSRFGPRGRRQVEEERAESRNARYQHAVTRRRWLPRRMA